MNATTIRPINRRTFLKTSALGASLFVSISQNGSGFGKSSQRVPELEGAIGIVTASAQAQLTRRAKGRNFFLLELPKILREELDMTVIDLNTSSIPDFAKVERSYLDKLRKAADKAGCVITNLKMNQPGLDMNSREKTVREKALVEYKRSIDIASHLGCRWARPLPRKNKPDWEIHVASYRELCDYAAPRKVQLLVENYGWMQADTNSVVELVKAIGENVAAGVDTGNWDSNEIRYEGLKQSFPIAATCDFKARTLGQNGEHPLYNLRKCFDIAWTSGFRGPWCLEHGNTDTKSLFRELGMLRDMLRKWTAEATSKETE
ncbi:MAG: TIM barrel protein [Planctomycetaceae bacterium]|nr:TIM barrel protein [Planctomycetaceae bacterium]